MSYEPTSHELERQVNAPELGGSTVSSSPSEHTSVRPVACLRCRNRRSYCSKDKPICLRCRDGSFECVYEEARKITVNELYLRDLEAKVKAYETMIAERLKATDKGSLDRNTRAPNRRAGRPPRTSFAGNAEGQRRKAGAHDSDEQFEDDHVLLGPFTQLSLDKHSTNFKGPGSSDNFLRNVRQLSGVPGDDGRLDLNPNFYDPGELPSRRLAAIKQVRLPPLDIARRLFAAQYTYIGTIFAFTDPTAFDQELIAAYREQPDLSDKDACLAYAKVLITLAFGQLYSVNQWIDFKGPPGFEYFAHAVELLPDAHEEGSILCVETLALVGYFMQNMNRRDAAFLYIGMALRMAISLGLHQEVKPSSGPSIMSPDADEAVREHRRRVWWSVYSLDRILSAKSGNPITIQDEDIGVLLPSKLPGEADYCPAVVLRHYTQLSRILGDITKSIYSRASQPKSGRRLMASVQSTILALSNWNQDLPEELRFEPSRLSTNRESVSTFSHYYQCINMTARPLFFHVVQRRLRDIRNHGSEAKEKDWREGLGQTTVKMIEMCVSAAQDTVHMMTIAAQRDLVATYGYMDGEHIFSAAIVLVMVCIAFPTNAANMQAMNAGLTLLRGMAERGNSHMGARYELLAHLRCSAFPDDEGPSVSMWHQQFDINISSMTPNVSLSSPTGSSHWSPVKQSPSAASLIAAQVAVSGASLGLSQPGPAVADHQMGSAAEPSSRDNPPNLSNLGTSSGGRGISFNTNNNLPLFSMVDHRQLREAIYDESANTGTDFMFWEEGFANPAADSGFDLAQLTQTVETNMYGSGDWLGGLEQGTTGSLGS